jgi:hypothetical protein
MPSVVGSKENKPKQNKEPVSLPAMSKSASMPAVLGAAGIPKMRKMTVEDQACFMILSEHVHPSLRLQYPAANKTLAGIAAYIVNTLMAADSILEGLEEFFGKDAEMLSHALNNVGSVAEAAEYPGTLFLIVPYIPSDDDIVKMQITAVVEYVSTELLAMAGAVVNQLKDQAAFSNDKREGYDDFPKIRPSDLKKAVEMDPELRGCIGTLFKF